MAIAWSPGTTWGHVPKADRELPAAEQTAFTLKHLYAREMEQVECALFGTGAAPFDFQAGNKINTLLRLGLRGWYNFRDETGAQIEFAPDEQGMCAWANIDRLGPALRFELAMAIDKGNRLSEGDRKNS